MVTPYVKGTHFQASGSILSHPSSMAILISSTRVPLIQALPWQTFGSAEMCSCQSTMDLPLLPMVVVLIDHGQRRSLTIKDTAAPTPKQALSPTPSLHPFPLIFAGRNGNFVARYWRPLHAGEATGWFVLRWGRSGQNSGYGRGNLWRRARSTGH